MRLELLEKIYLAREQASLFFDKLHINNRSKYTINHNVEKYPAASLYGAWSIVHGKTLIHGAEWDLSLKNSLKQEIISCKMDNGLIFPEPLLHIKPAKSFEYLKLHTFNYAFGALHALDENIQWESSYMDHYCDTNRLAQWLDGRSFSRPWEESNNIVNVASYIVWKQSVYSTDLAECLKHLIKWHNQYQDPRTGGFGNLKPSYKGKLESMAGAVHNFHLHHYLECRMNYEDVIALSIIPLLYEGHLTACLSIDFVELGVNALSYISDELRSKLIKALIYHTQCLLKYQNEDGGWNESDKKGYSTSAAGMTEDIQSSCSYATWFRLCSLGFIAISLLGDNEDNWHFRKTLGMGYSSMKFGKYPINDNFKIQNIDRYKSLLTNSKGLCKKEIINLASKVI